MADRKKHDLDLAEALNKTEPVGVFLVEHPKAEPGAAVFFCFLVLYNIVMPAWFFLGEHTVFQEITIALMWIGGNQAFAFMCNLARNRVFEVRRLPPPSD